MHVLTVENTFAVVSAVRSGQELSQRRFALEGRSWHVAAKRPAEDDRDAAIFNWRMRILLRVKEPDEAVAMPLLQAQEPVLDALFSGHQGFRPPLRGGRLDIDTTNGYPVHQKDWTGVVWAWGKTWKQLRPLGSPSPQ